METILKEFVDFMVELYKGSLKDIKEIGVVKKYTADEAYNLYIIPEGGENGKELQPIQVSLGIKDFFALIEHGKEYGTFNPVFQSMHNKIKSASNGLIDFSPVEAIIENLDK